MPDLPRDDIMGRHVPLGEGERVLAEFGADRGTYWRAHAILAVVAGVLASGVLWALGNSDPWVGPVAALLAIGVRAGYLASEALAETWRLTDRRLIGPGGREVALSGIATARAFLGGVQVVTRSGDKHLIRYLADPEGTAARIRNARPR
jgi:hypothetical protein